MTSLVDSVLGCGLDLAAPPFEVLTRIIPTLGEVARKVLYPAGNLGESGLDLLSCLDQCFSVHNPYLLWMESLDSPTRVEGCIHIPDWTFLRLRPSLTLALSIGDEFAGAAACASRETKERRALQSARERTTRLQ